MTTTLTGPAGTAEVVDLDARPHNAHAALAAWFLTCPGQSLGWASYGLSIVHLREDPGLPPAELDFPEATHQIILAALDPGRNPTADNPGTWVMLHPLNWGGQVSLPDDDTARGLLRTFAEAVVLGELWAEPPLSGQTEPWRTAVHRAVKALG